jgi:hypothetical protein
MIEAQLVGLLVNTASKLVLEAVRPSEEELPETQEGEEAREVLERLGVEAEAERALEETRPKHGLLVRGRDEMQLDRADAAPVTVGAAFALEPDKVFADARRRVSLAFRVSMAIAICAAALLVVGVVGALIGAFMGKALWAAIFGGISAVDVLGALIYRPLKHVNAAVINAQRLDFLFLGWRERLRACQSLSVLEKRIECSTQIWLDMKKDLETLEVPPTAAPG